MAEPVTDDEDLPVVTVDGRNALDLAARATISDLLFGASPSADCAPA
jgi:hypothetical protein